MIASQYASTFYILSLFASCLFATPTRSEEFATSHANCKKVKSENERLKCYDRIGNEAQEKVEGTASSGGCGIEDWTYTEKAGSIYINGTTTCPNGKLIYRLYDGSSGKFIASDFTYFEGYAFQSYTDGKVPAKLQIKYSIETR